MPKVVFVKKAVKDNEVCKKGESYYWWQNYRGPKQFSKERPRPSRTVGSGFLSDVYSKQEQIEDMTADQSVEDIKAEVDNLISEIQDLASEQEDKLSNMPDSLQQGPTGELLQNRAEELNSWADELQSAVDGAEDEEEVEGTDEEKEEIEEANKTKRENLLEEVQVTSYNGE